jgi:protein-tyrosine phosphatase
MVRLASVLTFFVCVWVESDRVVKLENVHNFRDMGGYATTSGKKVKRGILFRSADPSGTPE